MEIVWYGHSCFRISERGKGSVVTDPFDAAVAGYSPLKLKAEIVTVSCNDPVHNYSKTVKGDPLVISGPGEYEVSGVFITGMHTVSKEPTARAIRCISWILARLPWRTSGAFRTPLHNRMSKPWVRSISRLCRLETAPA